MKRKYVTIQGLQEEQRQKKKANDEELQLLAGKSSEPEKQVSKKTVNNAKERVTYNFHICNDVFVGV